MPRLDPFGSFSLLLQRWLDCTSHCTMNPQAQLTRANMFRTVRRALSCCWQDGSFHQSIYSLRKDLLGAKGPRIASVIRAGHCNMYSYDFIPWDHSPTITLSPAQQNAVSTHLAGLTEAFQMAGLNLPKTDPQQSSIAHAQPPQAPLDPIYPLSRPLSNKQQASTSSNNFPELDTTIPLHDPPVPQSVSADRPPTPDTLQSHEGLIELWTSTDLERATQLIRARRKCHATLVETSAHLVEIESELSSMQRGRRPRRQGGNWSHRRQADSSDTANTSQPTDAAGSGRGKANAPPFLSVFLPAPSPLPSPPNDPPGTKRCMVGRPMGKVLKPNEPYYHLGKCDKHHDKSVFETNMQVQRNTEGGYRMREHAWKCSGEGTKRWAMHRR